jgi:hypothetical protein
MTCLAAISSHGASQGLRRKQPKKGTSELEPEKKVLNTGTNLQMNS